LCTNIGKKIKRNLRDYGILVCLKKICSGILSPIFEMRKCLLYVVDLLKVEIKSPQLTTDIVLKFINSTDDELISQIEDMEDWLQGKLKAKLDNKQKCLAAIHNNTMVAGFNLIGFDSFKLPKIHFNKPLRRFECFSDQITVHPSFRNRGLGTDLRHAVFSAMKSEGYHRMYGATDFSNNANRALTRKVGFKTFALVQYLNFFGCKRHIISRVKKCS
jgi:GNAT superfamily N-acetyltransferase